MVLKTAHGFSLASLFNQRHRRVISLYYNTSQWQIISRKPFLKRAAIKSARIVDDMLLQLKMYFFYVMTGTRSVFVFLTHSGPVYTNPSFTKLSQS